MIRFMLMRCFLAAAVRCFAPLILLMSETHPAPFPRSRYYERASFVIAVLRLGVVPSFGFGRCFSDDITQSLVSRLQQLL